MIFLHFVSPKGKPKPEGWGSHASLEESREAVCLTAAWLTGGDKDEVSAQVIRESTAFKVLKPK